MIETLFWILVLIAFEVVWQTFIKPALKKNLKAKNKK